MNESPVISKEPDERAKDVMDNVKARLVQCGHTVGHPGRPYTGDKHTIMLPDLHIKLFVRYSHGSQHSFRIGGQYVRKQRLSFHLECFEYRVSSQHLMEPKTGFDMEKVWSKTTAFVNEVAKLAGDRKARMMPYIAIHNSVMRDPMEYNPKKSNILSSHAFGYHGVNVTPRTPGSVMVKFPLEVNLSNPEKAANLIRKISEMVSEED